MWNRCSVILHQFMNIKNSRYTAPAAVMLNTSPAVRRDACKRLDYDLLGHKTGIPLSPQWHAMSPKCFLERRISIIAWRACFKLFPLTKQNQVFMGANGNRRWLRSARIGENVGGCSDVSCDQRIPAQIDSYALSAYFPGPLARQITSNLFCLGGWGGAGRSCVFWYCGNSSKERGKSASWIT